MTARGAATRSDIRPEVDPELGPERQVVGHGRVLVRDRGAIRQTYLFDTEGDDMPGGIFLELLEERVSGPHPGFFMSEEEFCAVVTPLLN